MNTTNRTMICPKCGAENFSWRSRCQKCGILLHEEDEVSTVKYHRRDYLRLSALITGLIGAGGVAFSMWFISIFAGGRITRPIDWLFVLGIGLFVLGNVAVAGKWPLIGGVLLIVESLVPIGYFVWANIPYGFNPFWVFFFLILLVLPYLIPGLSLLASGVLFILIWRKGQRPSKETGS